MSDDIHPLIGVPLLAVGYPLWCHSGQRFSFEPGDVFEVDADDVTLGLVDPDFWLRAGVVQLATPEHVQAAQAQAAAEAEALQPPGPVSRETTTRRRRGDEGAEG